MQTMNERRKLTAEETADAKRLREVWSRKKEELKLTQEKVGAELGWKTQSTVSQYLNGKIALNLNALVKLSEILEVAPEQISPRIARKLSGIQHLRNDYDVPLFSGLEYVTDDEMDSYARLKLVDVKRSTATGRDGALVFDDDPFPLLRSTLSDASVSARNAAAVRVVGTSLEPVLNDSDTVVFNLDDIAPIKDGRLYVFRDLEMIRINVLYARPGAGLRIRSFNTAEYPDEDLTANEVEARVRILGKVFWSEKTW